MSGKRARAATLVERGAVDTLLSDYEGNSEIGPFEKMLVLRIVARIGLSGTWEPIVVSHLADELRTSRQTVRNAIDAVSGDLLDFDVRGSESGRGRRVNLAKASQWMIDRVREVIEQEKNNE
ncbi:hypothetical protein [Brevibacterium aurantiacum]|uniref:Uncharacterized protein n=1 Tax=Brevibacterium aurantiacum TaxID=273384 RepID=A0A2A3ZP64_BREAU|nr:hypothetical protein [Brevibacterium aurantiacum]AZT92571.1 hypothetical protein CXR23_04935 [Brevibacterium aurantiacum]PCC53460.1 hypothetical protein CIK59_12145 [Brevibacterium aurantiacum]GEB21922.1 hypothetical protein BAU01nite_06550 [Brevibacterium aurantiacum]SMX92758.1 hypothetical protein BAUR9175_02951 [Brevibacterium aurantiacum]